MSFTNTHLDLMIEKINGGFLDLNSLSLEEKKAIFARCYHRAENPEDIEQMGETHHCNNMDGDVGCLCHHCNSRC